MRLLLSALIALVTASLGNSQQPAKGKPTQEASLYVTDPAELFSSDAVKKTKATMAEVVDRNRRQMYILTFKELPEAKKKAFEKLDKDDKAARGKFFRDWAIEEAKDEKASGVFVLICRKPGQVEILADKAIRDKGFTHRDEEHIAELLISKLREAAETKDKTPQEQTAIRDKGLIAAVDFVRDAYKKMVK